MTIKIANYIPWRELLELHEVDAQCDDEGWDDFLEAAEDGGQPISSVRRVSTPTPNFHRHDASVTSSWDTEFLSAQSHAREVISRLGK